MKNKEYFEAIVNSNLDGEAKALALTALVNARTSDMRGKTVAPNVSAYSWGVQNKRTDITASLVALLFETLLEKGECRCKDIANLYNERVGARSDRWYETINYRNVSYITNLLVSMRIIQRVKKPQLITITREVWREGERFTVSEDKVVDIPYFQFAE